MKFIIVLLMFLAPFTSHADNSLANITRVCQKMPMGTSDNYIVRCARSDDLTDIQNRKTSVNFFPTDNNADRQDIILGGVNDDDKDYVYVNVKSDVGSGKTCYNVITYLDDARGGYYGINICE